MSNSFYNHTDGVPAAQSRGASPLIRTEFDLVGAGFDAVAAALNAKESFAVHTSPDKPTPVDADEVAITNSAATYALNKVTWANLKATLVSTWKDATGGFVGLTLFAINFKNAANTFTSFFTNSNTAARTYTFQDKSGTVAHTSDTHDATAKANPVDADELPLADSAASWVLKKYTIANLKAACSTSMQNIVHNSEFNITTGYSLVSKYNTQSTASQVPISVSSYTTGANTVVCLTSDTQQAKVGDLVAFSAAADTNLQIIPLRITALVANTSFTVVLSQGLTASASAACAALPVMSGDISGSTGAGPDGWTKSVSVYCWIEDSTNNIFPGTSRVVGLQKTVSGAEYFYFTGLSNIDITRYQGQTVTFGMSVNHKIKNGSGTYRLFINNNGVLVYSSSATTTGLQWFSVTSTIADTATIFQVGIELNGAINDVYFIGKPYGVIGASMATGAFAPIQREYLIPLVKFSPWINRSITFPASTDAAGTYSFAFDIYQESSGSISPNVRMVSFLLEGINSNAVVTGSASVRCIAWRDVVSPPIKYSPVLAQYVSNVKSFENGILTLSGGKAIAYSAVASDSWYNVSIDVDGMWLN